VVAAPNEACGAHRGDYLGGMFGAPISEYMTRALVTIGPTATLEHARELIERTHISALPVMDTRGRAMGVVSRSDLLRVGRIETNAGRRPALRVPDEQVDSAMGTGMVTATPDTSVAEAARLMLDRHIHRVFVEDERHLVGVFSTRDVMRAVVDARIEAPLSSVMSSPVITVDAASPIRDAIDLLGRAGVSGLAVLERGTPVGTFTQEDALAARLHRREDPVAQVMGYWFVVLPVSTAVHQAAARAVALKVRHILVTDDGSLGSTIPPEHRGDTEPAIRPPGGVGGQGSPGSTGHPDRLCDTEPKIPPRGGLVGVVTGLDLAGAALLA